MADEDDVVLPPWQPDDELSSCSICSTPFTFLNRRHHCRRCGRLVCGPCSPHRITIPRQYIVRPPEETLYDGEEAYQSRSRSNTDPSYYPDNPALGGGENVRVCNPCVPDPNYGPPPQHDPQAATSPPSSIRSRAQTSGQESSIASPRDVARTENGNGEELFHTHSHSAPLRDRPFSSFSGASQGPPEDRGGHWRPELHTARYQALQSLPPRSRTSSYPVQTSHNHSDTQPTTATTLSRNRYRAPSNPSIPAGYPIPSTSSAQQSPHRHPRSYTRAPQPPQPVAPVHEEDECPVCGTREPPFGAAGDSTERERHVEHCISTHFISAGPSTATPPVTTNAFPPRVSSSPLTDAAATPSSPSVQQRGAAMLGASTARQRMLVYHATEKDAFDEEGEAQECVICFEEFQPGDEMGRLECLCKFHRACIRGWWEMKGRGTCPTHQLHD